MKVELITDRTRLLLAVHREGKPTHRDRFDPQSAKARKRIADDLGLDPSLLSSWCEEVRVKGGAMEFTVEPPKTDPRIVTVRPIEASASESVPIGDPKEFIAKLSTVPLSSVAEWEGTDELCCLDVDYHNHKAPDRNWLKTIILTRLHPKPIAWHFSKSGGLHLFFLRAGVFRADELAACAALRFRTIDASAGLELKRVVRGPGSEPVRSTPDQDTGTGFIEWLGVEEYDEADRDAWLDTESMECGRRYDHTKCPIDPSDTAERDPVLVSDTGIMCFRCNGKGLTRGSRRPGFVPWAAILGSPSAGEVGNMIRRLTHWGHAKWVLTERFDLPLPLARLGYSAALKAYHEGKRGEALIPAVFDERTDQIARTSGAWMTIEESHAYDNRAQAILACLPAAQSVNADGEFKADLAKVCELSQGKDLTRYGYKPIEVIHGYKMAQQFLADTPSTRVAVVNPPLRAHSNRCLPRYVRPTSRMPMDEAWGLIETVLPRVDRTYIRVLLAAFGCAQETRAGLLPVIFAEGPSAAGKTAMIQIAAGILGARVGTEAAYEEDPARYRMNIHEGGQQGPVVVLNELLKDAARGRSRATVREALDVVLNLTPWSSSHKLYTGPVKMGRLPAIVITEPVCPACLQDETQLARRIRHYKVEGKKDEWRQTIAKAGLSADLHMIRTVSQPVARACDAVLSEVIDTFFSTPMTWDETADALGVKTIEQSEAFEDRTPWYRELFRLVCAAPALEGREAKMYSQGFKKIVHGESGDLDDVYSMFADGIGSEWMKARRLEEKDWAKLLGTDSAVWVDVRGYQGDVFIRFGTGPKKTPTKVNQSIVDPSKWEAML